MDNFNQITLERQVMNLRFKRRSGGRRFGLALYLIESILAIALAIAVIVFRNAGILNFIIPERDFQILIVLGVMLFVLIQTLYYVILLSSNVRLQKPYRSAVLAILFFPIFGLTYLLYTALERCDKRKTSKLNFFPISNEFEKIEAVSNEVDKIIAKRTCQISFWSGTPDHIETLTPQVRKQVNELEEAVEKFITVFRNHGLGVFYSDAVAVKYMFESALEAKARAYRAKDMEMFFDRHVDAVKTCKKYLSNV